MRFGPVIKEKLARVIGGEYFTTKEITNIFSDAGITTDEELFAKWKITLDAFNKMPNKEEDIPRILETFCHPLNFPDAKSRNNFVKKLNSILSYENLKIESNSRGATILSDFDNAPYVRQVAMAHDRTPADFIRTALNFFKDEYNKTKIGGLPYEYLIGENKSSPMYEFIDTERDRYVGRSSAIEQLKEVGFIREYKIEMMYDERSDTAWDIAICKIDEIRLTQADAPSATDAGVQAIAQKVVHEHVHRFENSIQEKSINLNHKTENSKVGGPYISKSGDDFSYKGRYVNLSKKTDYYQAFCALYAKLPAGGEISYKDLVVEIKSRLPKTKIQTDDEIIKLIQRNLTDRNNGFMRYAGIPETEDNGKPLIDVIRGFGITFNNGPA